MEQKVGSLKCPNCGGDAAPDKVICSWCGSSLASVACPQCFASIFVGMKHCPYCGVEVAREAATQRSAGKCPRCEVPMVQVRVGGTDVSECLRCGGLWVDKTSFQAICEEREEQEAVLGMASPASTSPELKAAANPRVYIPCPLCGDLMNRVNFAGCSGVVIDWCKDHGTWFDQQELRQIVAFIQSGGLKKSREREIEKLQDETRRLKDQALLSARLQQSEGIVLENGWKNHHGLLADILSAVWKGLSKG
jgi:Zn-finger nucleic acid-binding protein